MGCREAITFGERHPILSDIFGTPVAAFSALLSNEQYPVNPLNGHVLAGGALQHEKESLIFAIPPAGRAAEGATSGLSRAVAGIGDWVREAAGSAWERAGNVWERFGCSFSETTPVSTAEGLKPIGELKTGDRVLARNEVTGTYAFEPITQVFRHQDPVKVHLTLEDPATGATEVIETTPEHPFHVAGRGFVPVALLKPNDAVSRASDEPASTSSVVRLIAGRSDMSDVLRVSSLIFENRPFWAYNLEVGEDHTFFVGANRAWVHNGPCGKFVGSVLRPAGEKFGGGNFGNAIHEGWADMLRKANPETEFIFRVRPGQTGVDAQWVSGPNPFAPYKFADLKPMTESGQSSFFSQVRGWRMTRKVRPYWYDELGNIYVGSPRSPR